MKRILCLILALLMVFSLLAGCGSKSDKDDEEEKDGTSDVQKEENDEKDEKDESSEIQSSQTDTVVSSDSVVGVWNVDYAAMGEVPEGVEVEYYTVTFTSSGNLKIEMKASYEGEAMDNSLEATYRVDGSNLVITSDGEEEVWGYQLSGNTLTLVVDGESIVCYK